jgi:hypothetical protein
MTSSRLAPESSLMRHLIVPVCVMGVFVLPYPTTDLFQVGTKVPETKSDLLWDIVLVQQLSILIGLLSVSKCI